MVSLPTLDAVAGPDDDARPLDADAPVAPVDARRELHLLLLGAGAGIDERSQRGGRRIHTATAVLKMRNAGHPVGAMWPQKAKATIQSK